MTVEEALDAYRRARSEDTGVRVTTLRRKLAALLLAEAMLRSKR